MARSANKSCADAKLYIEQKVCKYDKYVVTIYIYTKRYIAVRQNKIYLCFYLFMTPMYVFLKDTQEFRHDWARNTLTVAPGYQAFLTVEP